MARRGPGSHNLLVGMLDRPLQTRRARRMALGAGAAVVLAAAWLTVRAQPTAPATRAQPTDPATCAPRSFEGTRFTVCPFDTERDELRLAWRGSDGRPLRGFAALGDALGSDARRVRFAMNAGMFDAAGAPVGLLVAGSAVLHPLDTGSGTGNFYLAPNGVFSIDRDGVHIEPTATYAARDAAPVWATQSGPMLVIGGALHPAIATDGPSRTIRNGVGARDAHTAVFAISEEPVSFGRFARLFRDELHCRDALYLDGAISSLWQPAAGRRDAGHALGPIAVVLQRP